MTNSPLSTTSNEQSISCDNDATDHCESQLVTTSKNSSDDCQYNNNNNELIVTDKHFNGYDQDGDVLTIDMERLNCERQMKMEQLMKEQEELDVLVEKVFAKHARDRMNMADTIKQMESHAESIIDNALNVLLRSSSNSTTAHDLDQEELDAVLRQRRIDLQNEREQWLKTTEQEDKLLSECVSNEAEERRRKSMNEIAKKMAEVDLLVLSKSGKEREKYDVICSEIMNDHNILEDFVVSMRERADERSVMLQSQIDLIERALLDISLIEMNRRNEKVDTNAVKEECSSETNTATTSQPTPSSGHRSIIRAHYEEECVVCMSNSVKLLISPCGHVCLCEECATSLDDCPMCRTRITNRILLSGTN
ncbi:unnamed protein product [Anisakis simplex]|uniref:E3 ubiquitin-protein ligase LRSAM1 (inferred by orthology to a human protein) n=1 Tax=Anisakis simplex TaxID=6269 RepID=A0A0M3K728_ANISI|nr:unnamed protein product [Anisakis simplex]